MGHQNVVRAIYLFNLARQQGTNGGRSLDDGSMGSFGPRPGQSCWASYFDRAEELGDKATALRRAVRNQLARKQTSSSEV